jgi:hypothetical protein
MKQLIVMVSAIMLGLYIFNLVIGRQEGSVAWVVREMWVREIDARSMDEFPGDAV